VCLKNSSASKNALAYYNARIDLLIGLWSFFI
jgi:hypothetical protein